MAGASTSRRGTGRGASPAPDDRGGALAPSATRARTPRPRAAASRPACSTRRTRDSGRSRPAPRGRIPGRRSESPGASPLLRLGTRPDGSAPRDAEQPARALPELARQDRPRRKATEGARHARQGVDDPAGPRPDRRDGQRVRGAGPACLQADRRLQGIHPADRPDRRQGDRDELLELAGADGGQRGGGREGAAAGGRDGPGRKARPRSSASRWRSTPSPASPGANARGGSRSPRREPPRGSACCARGRRSGGRARSPSRARGARRPRGCARRP